MDDMDLLKSKSQKLLSALLSKESSSALMLAFRLLLLLLVRLVDGFSDMLIHLSALLDLVSAVDWGRRIWPASREGAEEETGMVVACLV